MFDSAIWSENKADLLYFKLNPIMLLLGYD